MAHQLQPTSLHEAASALAEASAAGQAVRILGAGTKAQWGAPAAAGAFDLELCTGGLDRIVEHNAGDLTAVLEAGLPLASAQRTFAAAGQRLALDPWEGAAGKATVGGVLATGDSGPLRHRYGAPRDLVLGMTVLLSDGTVASSGGKVIKNVAGYDLAKLFCGSFGTLGLIASVSGGEHRRSGRAGRGRAGAVRRAAGARAPGFLVEIRPRAPAGPMRGCPGARPGAAGGGTDGRLQAG